MACTKYRKVIEWVNVTGRIILLSGDFFSAEDSVKDLRIPKQYSYIFKWRKPLPLLRAVVSNACKQQWRTEARILPQLPWLVTFNWNCDKILPSFSSKTSHAQCVRIYKFIHTDIVFTVATLRVAAPLTSILNTLRYIYISAALFSPHIMSLCSRTAHPTKCTFDNMANKKEKEVSNYLVWI